MSYLQQVNLYSDDLKAQKVNYSAAVVLKLNVVILIALSLVTGFLTYQSQQKQVLLTTQQEKQQQATNELKLVQAELSNLQKDATLRNIVEKKSQELSNKQKVLGILSKDEFGNTIGFIEHISGLARQRIDGLWLTNIRIASGGTDIALDGSTSKPTLLPKYLQKLSAEKVFSGTEFQSLVMSRQEKQKKWLSFSLKNKNITEVSN